jgi:hypothetical protein
MKIFPKPLDAMRAFNQFVLWKAVASKSRPGKFDKFPCNIEGNIVDAHNPKHWNEVDTALSVAGLLGDDYGVGFVFTENDPFFFVDIDGAYDGEKWNDIATELCRTFAGCAVEVSHSGKGLHIFGTYSGEELDHGCKNIPLSLELYTSGRFVAMTGTAINGDSSFNCDNLLPVTIEKYFPMSESEHTSQNWTTTHCENSNPPPNDDKLIEKALKSSAALTAETIFGGKAPKANFKDLWTCNVKALTDSYPDEIRDYDASSVDAALAQHLSFWTGGNCERIEKLMRASGLVRDKWDYHKSYMERTITGACARQSEYYNIGAAIDMVDTSELIVPVFRDGYQLLSATQQTELFKGCVYIAETNRIFTPNGSMFKENQFKAMYGGYNFIIDTDGEKTSKNAWEAFTESQCLHNPKVDSMTFRPELTPGSIIETDGLRFVNTYVPIDVEMSDGDITPFNDHLSRLIPDERDRTILLSYMAACVQFKGYKIQWAPLIQGYVGNGKTLLTRCVAHAVGKRYSHWPKASKLDSEFNLWMSNKIFIAVEDIFVSQDKNEVLETLKPMITGGDGIEIQGKGADQKSGDICCNFMFNTNHKNAIKDVTKDRRYCVFYTAQQEKIDLARDGMDGDYFYELYSWLKGTGTHAGEVKGYAKVAQFLTNYAIPVEFNPTLSCQTAPTTSSTAEASTLGMGSVEQEVVEAMDEGRTGFSGGWVSSFALDRLIDNMRKGGQVPRNKRRELMRSIGYDYHPGLKDGRVNNVIAIEEGKPRLYIKVDHIHCNLSNGAEISRCYAAAQGDPLAVAASVDNSVKNV